MSLSRPTSPPPARGEEIELQDYHHQRSPFSSFPRQSPYQPDDRESQIHGQSGSGSRAASPFSAPGARTTQGQEQGQLPAQESGSSASWGGAPVFLLAATTIETVVWGFANSYGAWLEHYLVEFPSARDRDLLNVVGTISTGAMYLLMPLSTSVVALKPRWRSAQMVSGLIIMLVGMISAAFSRSAAGLIATQGVLYAIGGTMLYAPTTSYLFTWFTRRLGLATAVVFAGTGLGGLVVPLIASALLKAYGRRTTLLSFAIVHGILLGSAIPFVRPRRPGMGSASALSAKAVWKSPLLRSSVFWLIISAIHLQALAAFVPGTYLPSYTALLPSPPPASSTILATLPLSVLNAARIPGQLILGHLSDQLDLRLLVLFSSLGSALVVLAGWGCSRDLGGLVGFALAFGLLAWSYTALFPRFISAIAHDIDDTDVHSPVRPQLYALMSFARGLGSLLSGPISAALLHAKMSSHYGLGGYGPVILYTGSVLLASSVAAGYTRLQAR